jgi:hypothetical protein
MAYFLKKLPLHLQILCGMYLHAYNKISVTELWNNILTALTIFTSGFSNLLVSINPEINTANSS